MPKQEADHFTPTFKKAWKKVEKALKQGDEEAARIVFRDEMVALGHEERVKNLYRVKDKLTEKAVFFVLNGPQLEYMNGRKGRDIILKTRQLGFTTLAGVRGLDYTLWEPNKASGIMAHQQDVVKTIFEDLVKFSYDWFRRDWGSLYQPKEKSDSATSLGFEEDGLGRPLNSSMRVMFSFRSKTPNYLHVSEAAYIENERLLGSLNGVPATGEVVLESTANGRAGEFHRQWQTWKKLKDLAPYKGFFFPWPRFYPEQPEKWALPEDSESTTYEQTLLDAGLEEHHVAWRRWCIEANCQGDSEQFEREYPSNDIDCFISAGEASVFPSAILKSQLKNCRLPSKVGFLLSDGSKKSELHLDPKGAVAIWEEPDAFASYVIGADPSGGIGKDLGAAYVLNQKTKTLVARLWGQFDPADFAQELFKLANYYNKAWICCEVNNHGHLVCHILTTKGYKNLYKRKTIDELTAQPTSKVGFLTTSDSKIMVTEKFKTVCKNGEITILDEALVSEMSSYTQISSKTGRSIRREASAGAHDDLVMAACFAQEMNSHRTVIDDKELLSAPSPDQDDTKFDPDTGFPAAI